MRSEIWEEIKTAFESISDAGPDERERVLSEMTEEVRREVEQMLRASDHSGQSAEGKNSLLPESSLIAQLLRDERTLQEGEILCNRFEIKQFLGSGGMGEVYHS